MVKRPRWTPEEQVQWKLRNLPEHLRERLQEILGSEAELAALLGRDSRKAARVNLLKTTLDEALSRLDALGIQHERVPWSTTTFFLDDPQERSLGHLFEHQAGHLFLHDAASTLPVQALDPQPGEKVLDLCAAPGGKSTHILTRTQDTGLLVANDPKPQRANHLVSTLDRTGSLSAVVTQRDARHGGWPIQFDRVLVDAPCTNLGGIHHTPRPAFRQHKDSVSKHVAMQRRMLKTAADATRPGGTIVYATCTLEPEENEGNAAWFAQQPGIELQPHGLRLEGRDPPECTSSTGRDIADKTLRIHPGDHDTDGFFVARFTKHETPTKKGETRTPSTADSPANTPSYRSEITPAGRDPIDQVIQHAGLDPGALEGTHAITTPARIWATRIPLEDIEALLPMGVTRIGQLFATEETHGPRLHFDAATRFGYNATDPIELSPHDARAWLAGKNVDAPTGTPRDQHRIITSGDQPIGAGRAYGTSLPSFVPKQRRVPDEPGLHGWQALITHNTTA
jgi:tRNA (cytosine49-C5)-methyltransferase